MRAAAAPALVLGVHSRRSVRRRRTRAAPTTGCCSPHRTDELGARITIAQQRVAGASRTRAGRSEAAELMRYEELLYDRLTGFPTLPVMIEHARELLERRGELTVLYIHFVWYEKIEEIYGWQKLDDVLETTANALRELLRARARRGREHHDGVARRR